MNYSTALRFFVVMLALIGAGLMAIVAQIAGTANAVAAEQKALHTPAVLSFSGARCFVAAFIALAVACGVIVCQ